SADQLRALTRLHLAGRRRPMHPKASLREVIEMFASVRGSICSRLAVLGAALSILHRAPRRPEVDGYRLRAIAKDRQNFVSRFCTGQAFTHRAIVQKFCD